MLTSGTVSKPQGVFDQYKRAVIGKSNFEARQIAREVVGHDVYWDWDREQILD